MNGVHNVNMVHKNKTYSPKVQRSRERRTKLIISQAMDMILHEGLEGLTMHKLAKRMDYAVGALYRYFPSKDDLLGGLQILVIEQTILQFEALEKLVKENADEELMSLLQLKAVIYFYCAFATKNPTQFRLIGLMMGDPREILSMETGMAVFKSGFQLINHVGQFLKSASEEEFIESGNPIQRTVLLWACLNGLLNTQKLDRFSPGLFNAKILSTYFMNTLLRGWGASVEQLEKTNIAFDKLVEDLNWDLVNNISSFKEGE